MAVESGSGGGSLVGTLNDLRSRIARLPRVSLGEFPTPLTECERLGALLGGPRIFMKREDLSGLALGGNKSRLLEFRLAEALMLGADVVVAGLDLQSNSARQLTAAANRLGMRTRLLLRPDGDLVWQGNLLIDRILGAEISFLSTTTTDMDQALREVADRERASGSRPYVMNHARFFGIGAALAGLEWTIETHEQLDGQGIAPTHFYLSSGGKCQAGMVIAQEVLSRAFHVVGVNAQPDAHDAVTTTMRIATETLSVLGLGVCIDPTTIDNRVTFAGRRFGVPTPAGIGAIELVARAEGILLDPIFSGKAMAGMVADIRQGRLCANDTVVFIHTGGIPAIFTHAQAFVPGSQGPQFDHGG